MSNSGGDFEVLEQESQDRMECANCLKLSIKEIKTKIVEKHKEALKRAALVKLNIDGFGSQPTDLDLKELHRFKDGTVPKITQSIKFAVASTKVKTENTDAE